MYLIVTSKLPQGHFVSPLILFLLTNNDQVRQWQLFQVSLCPRIVVWQAETLQFQTSPSLISNVRWLPPGCLRRRMFLLVCLLVCQVVFGCSFFGLGSKKFWKIPVLSLLLSYPKPHTTTITTPTPTTTTHTHTPKCTPPTPLTSSLLVLCVTVAHWEVEMRLVNND